MTLTCSNTGTHTAAKYEYPPAMRTVNSPAISDALNNPFPCWRTEVSSVDLNSQQLYLKYLYRLLVSVTSVKIVIYSNK